MLKLAALKGLLLSLPISLSLAALPAAQGTLPADQIEPKTDWPYPNNADFRRVVSGTYTPDGNVSSWILASGKLYFLFAPTVSLSVRRIADLPNGTTAVSEVYDVATLSDGVGIGHDSIVALTDVGLVEIEIDNIIDDTIDLDYNENIIDASWTGGTRILSAEVHEDGSAFADVVALTDGGDMLRMIPVAFGEFQLGIQEEYTQESTVDDVVVIPFDGVLSYALLAQNGLHVVDVAGVVEPIYIRHRWPGGFITRVDGIDGAWLVWIVRSPNNNFWYVQCTNGIAGFDDAYMFTAADDIVGLCAGDFDGDDYDDLVVSIRDERKALILFNKRVSPHFSSTAEIEISNTPAAPAGANDCVYDISSHHQAAEETLIVPDEDELEIHLFSRGHHYAQTTIDNALGLHPHYVGHWRGDRDDTFWLNLAYVPQEYRTWDIDIIIWRQPDATGFVEARSLLHLRGSLDLIQVPLENAYATLHHPDQDFADTPDDDTAINWADGSNYFLLIRFKNPLSPFQWSPPFLVGLGANEGQLDLPGSGPPAPVQHVCSLPNHNECIPPGIFGTGTITHITSQSTFPGFDPAESIIVFPALNLPVETD